MGTDTDWINQISLNDYTSGKTGLGAHFDDPNRFARPITTVRLFSDSRLSFGLRYLSTNKGTMVAPLKRGRVCVMQADSYASDLVKHTIRNCDLTHRSAALILRNVHPHVVEEAKEFK